MIKWKCFLLIPGFLATIYIFAAITLIIFGLQDIIGKADLALVLGNKVEEDGTPSPRLRARLDKTLDLYRAGYFPLVLVSGGIGKEGYDEAIVMRDYLVANGIPLQNILVDSKGVTTFASAQNTLSILRQRKLEKVFIISQYFHIPRARLALKRFGVSEIYSAHANFFETRDIYSLLREITGYVTYLFRPYKKDPGPL